VGYGDITPGNDPERRYALLTTFIGTGLFAYITGEITALATSRQASSQALESKLDAVKEFMKYYKLPQKLFTAVRDYYRGSFHHSFFSAEDLVSELPIDLARQVEHSIAVAKYTSNPWFRVVSMNKEHEVKLAPEDAKFMETLNASHTSALPHLSHQALPTSHKNGMHVHLSQIQYKNDYWVEHAQTGEAIKVPARELFYNAVNPLNATWTKRMKKNDSSHYFNFVDETQHLFTAVVSGIETRKVEAGAHVFTKGDVVDQINILEWGEVHIVGTQDYVFPGSFLGVCDKEFTTESLDGRLIFERSFYATTDCELTVLKLSHLHRCLKKYGHADLHGIQHNGKFTRLPSMVQTFQTTKSPIVPLDEQFEETPGKEHHKPHLSTLLNSVKGMSSRPTSKGKKGHGTSGEEVTQIQQDIKALTAKVDAMAAKNDLFQKHILAALNVQIPASTVVELTPVSNMVQVLHSKEVIPPIEHGSVETQMFPLNTTMSPEETDRAEVSKSLSSKRLQQKYVA